MAEIDVVLKRQWDLLRELSNSVSGLTLAELAEKFGVSEKTIKRDVKSIEAVFGALKSRNEAHGRKRYLYDRNPFSFGLSLDRNELLAIYIGQTLMTPLKGTCFWDGVQSGREKIKTILREETVQYAERVAPFFYQFEPVERRIDARMRPLMDEALKAMEESRVLLITYQSLRSSLTKTYEIHPYNFVYWRNSVYLVGFCTRDKIIKIWKFDRLTEAEALSKKFKKLDFDVDKYLGNVVEPFVGNAPVMRVRVRFTGYAARIIQEERFKAQHAIVEESEDSVLLLIETESGKTFVRWLLGFGSHAEILDPPDLREEFAKELKLLNAQYSNPVRVDQKLVSKLEKLMPRREKAPAQPKKVETDPTVKRRPGRPRKISAE